MPATKTYAYYQRVDMRKERCRGATANAMRHLSLPLSLYPAYGRRYRDDTAMLNAWRENKDFSLTLQGGPYTSVRDLEALKADASSVWLVQGNQRIRVA